MSVRARNCPFCNGSILIKFCDSNGNVAERDRKWTPELGGGWVLWHSADEEVGFCPIAMPSGNGILGRFFYNTKEDAQKACGKRWSRREGSFIEDSE